MSYFNPENWSENTLKEALIDEVKDINLEVLWSRMLTKMHVGRTDNQLSRSLLFLFVKNLQKDDVLPT